MTADNPALRIDVADLLTHRASRRGVHLETPLDSLAGSAARVPDDEPVVLDLVLERVSDGIVVRGTVRAVWRGTCGVCLTDLEHALTPQVGELFEPEPVEGDTYPLEDTRSTSSSSYATSSSWSYPSRRRARRPVVVPARRMSSPRRSRRRRTRVGRRCPNSISETERQSMAVPKRKTPRAKTRSRRAANWRLAAPPRSLCANCGAVKRPHVVCDNCGWYRDRQVIEVD